jgi:hypothetical protein
MLGTHLRPYQVRAVDPGVGLTRARGPPTSPCGTHAAARDRRLKPRVVGSLMELENHEARLAAPGPARDLGWMWKELGLKRP